MAKTTLNLRVDDRLKKDAERVLTQLGLTMSAAIAIYLGAIVRAKGIPFSLTIGRGGTTKNGNERKPIESPDDYGDLNLPESDSIRKAIDRL